MTFARRSFIALSVAAFASKPAFAAEDSVIFPGGAQPVQLPASFYPPHVVVRVTIAGHGLDFVLDTGAATITLDPKIASELGLQTANAVVPEMKIGEVTMRDVHARVAPIEEYPAIGVRVAGLLGDNFIRQCGLTVDYRNRRVLAVPAAAFRPPPASESTVVLPIDVSHHIPVVTAKINGAVADRIIVDTGAVADMLLFEYFRRQNPQALSSHLAKPIVFPKSAQVQGVYYRLTRVELGDLHFEDFDVAYVTSPQVYPKDADGLIGPGILANFTVTFDYTGGKMYLAVK